MDRFNSLLDCLLLDFNSSTGDSNLGVWPTSKVLKVGKLIDSTCKTTKRKVMDFKYFIGIDVSKKTLDFCLLKAGKTLLHLQTENDNKSIENFIRQCKQQFDLKLEESLFCMEHTGIYNYPLLDYFSGKQTSVWLESALHIKHSSGLQRGKNDKIDAERIAFYAYRNQDNVKLWQPARQVIKELKTLTALRNRLINAKKQLKSSLQEGKEFLDKDLEKKMQRCCQQSLKALDQDLAKAVRRL